MTTERYWILTQEKQHGTSRAKVRAADYFAALERGREIGFDAPESVVLDERGEMTYELYVTSDRPEAAELAAALFTAGIGNEVDTLPHRTGDCTIVRIAAADAYAATRVRGEMFARWAGRGI